MSKPKQQTTSVPADPYALHEEVRHLAAFGTDPERVATQLHTNPQALAQALRRHPSADPVIRRFLLECSRWVTADRKRRKQEKDEVA